MVRVYCEPPKGNAQMAIDNWVTNYQEWTADPTDHTLVETNTRMDGTGTPYLVGYWRFVDQGETPTNILQDLSDRLGQIQGGLWHRLVYHVCHHDEDTPQPCAWEQKREADSIPDDIPDPEVA